jgi:DNA (cytosine-5)-methyltransferase 1
MLTIGSLFSGIGGLELGLERAGLGPVVWQCETDWPRRKILRNFWDVPIGKDIRSLNLQELEPVDLICGGFPCQAVSNASHKRKLDGYRFGFWSYFRDCVGLLSPGWVVVENIFNQWRNWVPVVRRDLWGLGYSSVPIRVCAADIGAPHGRPRVFVVAHSDPEGELLRSLHGEVARASTDARLLQSHWRDPFSGPVRMAYGIPHGMDRIRAVGDAIVPQVTEVIGLAIVSALNKTLTSRPKRGIIVE